MASDWDVQASGWDDEPAVRAYAAAAFESLEAVLGELGVVLDNLRVLDFGCGTGLLTERLVAAGANVWAVDTSSAMLDVLRAKSAVAASGRVTASSELPPPGERFGLVVGSSVFAFVDDYPATAAALAGRLEPGGLFVQWDWERSTADDHGLTRHEIVAALTGAGLADVEVTVAFEADVAGHRMAPLMGRGRKPD